MIVLAMSGVEHAGQRRLDVVDGVVDDLVGPDVHALALGELFARRPSAGR